MINLSVTIKVTSVIFDGWRGLSYLLSAGQDLQNSPCGRWSMGLLLWIPVCVVFFEGRRIKWIKDTTLHSFAFISVVIQSEIHSCILWLNNNGFVIFFNSLGNNSSDARLLQMKAFISSASLPLSYSPPMYSSFLFPFLKAGVFQGIEIVVETAGLQESPFWKVLNAQSNGVCLGTWKDQILPGGGKLL